MPLLTVSRAVYAAIDRSTNPHLYARIFNNMFDLNALSRRLGQLNAKETTGSMLSAHVLADELVRRCRVMTRLRTSYLAHSDDGSRAFSTADEQDGHDELEEMLSVAFVMTLAFGSSSLEIMSEMVSAVPFPHRMLARAAHRHN